MTVNNWKGAWEGKGKLTPVLTPDPFTLRVLTRRGRLFREQVSFSGGLG